jgi:protein TonB
MKKILCVAFVIISGSLVNCYSQGFEFFPAETHPQFPGGEKELYCFIDRTINKELLQTIDTSGKVLAGFIIDTLGEIKDIKILKPLTDVANKELLRVVALMPRWKPGKLYDKVVEVKILLPLKIPYENEMCR